VLQFEMLPVDLPAQVDRAEMVVRQGGELTPVDTRQWAAPLANELRNAFSVALAQQLGAPDVYGLPHDATLPTWRIKLGVQRFDSALGASA
ncbi:ABC-type transport auxiliary lipoprotein family protein, partial [Acinetobacter baumannii]